MCGYSYQWLSIILMTITILIFGEIVPKTLAIGNCEAMASFVSRPIYLFSRAIIPLAWILDKTSHLVVSLLTLKGSDEEDFGEREELRTLVNYSQENGIIEETQKELIHNIFEFGNTRVSEVMSPRTDMFTLSIDFPVEDMMEEVRSNHYSRIPVYKNDRDNIIGILYAKDVLTYRMKNHEITKEELYRLLRPPYFVPETSKLENLLRTFQKKKIHIAIVVDEYGGVSGLVTMEDLLEELFGEIYDEFDIKEPLYEKIGRDEFTISAKMPISDFNKLFSSTIPDEEHDTLGGFIFSQFDRVPTRGEIADWEGIHFTVETMSGPRILKIKVKKKWDCQK